MSVLVTKRDIEEWIPKQWSKVSDFLELGLSWNDVLEAMEKKAEKEGKKFIGFSVGMNPSKLTWAFGLFDVVYDKKKGKGYQFLHLDFIPKNKSVAKAKKLLTHELVHAYQHTFLHKQRDLLNKKYKEAVAEVVANKIVKEKDYLTKHYYTDPVVMTLAEAFWRMPRKEFLEWAKRPKNKKDYEKLNKEIPKLLARGDYSKWVKKVSKEKK